MDITADMRDLLSRIYRSFADGDPAQWAEFTAPDVLMIGTDEVEWSHGLDVVLPILSAQIREMRDSGLRLTPGEPVVGGGDGSAWAADRPTMRLADGSEVPLRLTLVATRTGGRLQIRQLHLSVGAPNEEVLGETLTVGA